MVKIFNLADTDMIVHDAESGLNDYSKNLKFADELDDISKHLVGLSQECCEKANLQFGKKWPMQKRTSV